VWVVYVRSYGDQAGKGASRSMIALKAAVERQASGKIIASLVVL
jgi:hypothetical protein